MSLSALTQNVMDVSESGNRPAKPIEFVSHVLGRVNAVCEEIEALTDKALARMAASGKTLDPKKLEAYRERKSHLLDAEFSAAHMKIVADGMLDACYR